MNEASHSGSVLPGLEIAPTPLPPKADATPAPPRVKAVNRTQTMTRVVAVEQLIEEDHPARAIWAFVGKLDLQPFYAPIEAVEGVGLPPAVGSACAGLPVDLRVQPRDRLGAGNRPALRVCPAFQWLTGMEEINYHTLSDFRVGHGERLPELFVQVLGLLSAEGLVSLERVMHDGTKMASAAGDLPIRNVTPRQILVASTTQIGGLDRGWLDTLPQAVCVPRWSLALNTKPDDWPANLTAIKP